MAKSKTTPEHWSLRRLALSLEGTDDEIVLEVPSFQRQFVWSEPKQAELINSIRAGFPIGAIIICDSGETNQHGKQIYLLVDGLQRSLTIKALADSPFLDAKGQGDLIIAGEEYEALALKLGVGQRGASLQAAIAAYLKDVKKPEGVNWQPEKLLERCETDLAMSIPPSQRAEIRDATHLLMEKLRDDARQLLDTNIAVLRTEVPVENINEVFRRINDSGVALTKYQIWAASWLYNDVETNDTAIIKEIAEKQRARADDLKRYRIQLQDRHELSLYDYLDGLGRYIADKYTFLFRASAKPIDETPHAFIIAALVHGLRIDKKLEHELPHLMRGTNDKKRAIDTKDFENNVKTAVDVAAGALAPLLSFKTFDFEKNKEKHEFMHSDYFIAAFTAWLSLALVAKPSARKPLAESLLLHYVFEQISPAEKSHATDAQAFDSVWRSKSQDSTDLELNSTWATPIPRELFSQRLDQWFESDLNTGLSVAIKRKAPSLATKLLLRLVMLQRSKGIDAQLHYEVDHLIPWSRFEPWIKRAKSPYGWPVNSIGNLALVPRIGNRGKGKATVSEWLAKKDKVAKSAKYIREVLVLDDELLTNFDLKSSFTVTELEFRKLMSARWKILKKVILDALYEKAWE